MIINIKKKNTTQIDSKIILTHVTGVIHKIKAKIYPKKQNAEKQNCSNYSSNLAFVGGHRLRGGPQPQVSSILNATFFFLSLYGCVPL